MIDEMGYAEKSDVDVVKNVITADRLDRRPMRSNGIQPVKQNATLIGATNKSLAELIRDETGNRRFVGLHYKRPDDENFINSIDWTAAWRSIKHTDADPMNEHRDTLKSQQESARFYGPIESWLRALIEGEATLTNQMSKIRGQKLFEEYVEYREVVTAGRDPTPRTLETFRKELNRLIDNDATKYPLTKSRDSSGVYWEWKGKISPCLAVIQGGQS